MATSKAALAWWHHSSLRWRFLLIGALSMAPILVVTSHIVRDARESAMAGSRERVELLVSHAAENQADIIWGAQSLLGLLANSTEVQAGGAGCSQLLARHMALFRWVRSVRLSTTNGDGLCAGRPEVAAPNIGDRPFFQEALRGAPFVVSDLLVDRITGKPTLFAAMPLVRDGRTSGILSLAIVPDSFERWSYSRYAMAQVSMFLVDSKGTLIASNPAAPTLVGKNLSDHPAVKRALAGREGVADAPDLFSIPHLFAFRNLPGTNAVLAVGLNRAAVIEEIDEALRQRVIAAASLIALSLMVGLAGGEVFIFRPLRGLAETARQLEAGDLSARPKAEGAGEVKALARALVRMAKAIKEREQDLRLARDTAEKAFTRAEHANKAKTEFLASMSHEIRTPLNGIIGYTERLLDEPLTPDQYKYAERIQVSGSSLLTVVNDILDLSQIEAGRIELEVDPFSLEALIDNTVSIVTGIAEKKGLTIRVELAPDLPKMLLGDEARIRQILLNLLNNAVKFTREGHITLSVQTETPVDCLECLRFAVSDTGIGIPRDKRNRLFRRFSQVDSTIRREFGGTGLGLAISKRLTDLMNGQIGFESSPGHGSTFWVILRLPRAQALASRETGDQPAKATVSGRILLVEDLEINQELARAILERAGHRTHVVSDGAEAVAAVQAADYDLVLMDVQMPRMDGIAATREIRALPYPARQIPIVAMTANVLPQQVRSFKDAGMNDHIGKPIKRKDLLDKVAAWLPGADANLNAAADQGNIWPAGVFNRETFNEFAEMIGADTSVTWLKRLADYVDDSFLADPEQMPDRGQIAREAHAIVSQAASLGFSELAGACSKLEQACGSGADLAGPMDKARQAYASARPIMQELIGQPDGPRDS
jgi:signal transduction histidine kinase/HPt (histidine-containing phosphotransfer) domain-containing protein/ActR/RegA family two-component response regulator